jgi:hypothetical protein
MSIMECMPSDESGTAASPPVRHRGRSAALVALAVFAVLVGLSLGNRDGSSRGSLSHSAGSSARRDGPDPAGAARFLQNWGADWSADVTGARSDVFDTVVIETDLYPDADAVPAALAMCAALLRSSSAPGPLRINGQGDVVIASRHSGTEPCESRL